MNPIPFLKALPWKWIALAAAVVALWFGVRAWIAGIAEKARTEQADADAAAVKTAQDAATIAQTQAARATETGYARGTKEANDALQPALDDYRSRIDAYVIRVRQAKADKGGTSGTGDLPGTSNAPYVADEPGDGAWVSVGDMRICADNTGRLVNAKSWADETFPR